MSFNFHSLYQIVSVVFKWAKKRLIDSFQQAVKKEHRDNDRYRSLRSI